MSSFRNWFNLNEMPISNIALHGNLASIGDRYDKNVHATPGYEPSDMPFILNKQDELKMAWSNTKQKFYIHYVSSEQASKYVEVGKVSEDWVKEHLGVDIKAQPDGIVIIFTNNQGTERVPMTKWIVAHRLGHVLEKAGVFRQFDKLVDTTLEKILKQAYGFEVKWNSQRNGPSYMDRPSMIAVHQLAAQIGQMKGAKKLTKYYEFYHELVAQHITKGSISFNQLPQIIPALPRQAASYKGETGYDLAAQENFETWNDYLHDATQQMSDMLENILENMVGQILVM